MERPSKEDALVFDQLLGKIRFYEHGLRPLKLAYTDDIMLAIRKGREAERTEIVALLEAWKDRCAFSVEEAVVLIRNRGLARSDEAG